MKIALTIFALSLLLVGCHKQNAPARNSLTGTWLFETNYPNGTTFESSATVDSNGFYFSHIVSHGWSNYIRQAEIEGTWQIQGGFLIDTITKSSQSTNKDLHLVSRSQVIHFDGQELIVKYVGNGEKDPIDGLIAVFRKSKN